MTVFEYIKNHVNVKLAPSNISGVGVFALRDIKKGEELTCDYNSICEDFKSGIRVDP